MLTVKGGFLDRRFQQSKLAVYLVGLGVRGVGARCPWGGGGGQAA